MSYFAKLENRITDDLLYEGIASVNLLKNGMRIMFQDENYSYDWKIYEKGLVIRNVSEIEVVLTLRPSKTTRGHIETEFGEIELVCETLKYEWKDDVVEIRYDLVQGQDRQHFHFILYIYKEDEYGIH